MARRSILSAARTEKVENAPSPAEDVPAPKAKVKPSRLAKLHIGGYYDPNDSVIVAFQKLGIDLRQTQQEMILEALRDYVAKYEAAKAFG
jgi:ribosomal protein L13E